MTIAENFQHLKQIIGWFKWTLHFSLFFLFIFFSFRMIEQYNESLNADLPLDPMALQVMCPICQVAELKLNNQMLSCSCGYQWVSWWITYHNSLHLIHIHWILWKLIFKGQTRQIIWLLAWYQAWHWALRSLIKNYYIMASSWTELIKVEVRRFFSWNSLEINIISIGNWYGRIFGLNNRMEIWH